MRTQEDSRSAAAGRQKMAAAREGQTYPGAAHLVEDPRLGSSQTLQVLRRSAHSGSSDLPVRRNEEASDGNEMNESQKNAITSLNAWHRRGEMVSGANMHLH
jgi:hypothetical protein